MDDGLDPRPSARTADDELDVPPALPSWVPGSERTDPAPAGSDRVLAGVLVVLGAGGVASGIVLADTATEVVVGSFLIVLGCRALLRRTPTSRD